MYVRFWRFSLYVNVQVALRKSPKYTYTALRNATRRETKRRQTLAIIDALMDMRNKGLLDETILR